jgi:polysaccharide export outer membrane protein
MTRLGVLACMTAFFMLESCSTGGSYVRTPTAPVVEGTGIGTEPVYRLQVGDQISVHFLSFPDLDDSATIGPDGHVALRLVSDFQLADMTLAEATEEVNKHYEAVVRHPGVSLTIKSYALQQVYVDGEVNSPGVVRSSLPLTASGAIAQAGGVKLATARAHGALLIRRRSDGAIVYYKLVFHGDLPGGAGDPILRNNDLVYIPRTPIASVAEFIQGNILRMVPVTVAPTFVHTF